MASANIPFHSLNAGIVGKDAMARVDLAKMRITAERQNNLLPTVLGPAAFRPGTAYKCSTRDDDEARLIGFVFNTDNAALMEVGDETLRIILSGVPLSRPAVTAAVTSGTFAASTGWTLAATDGATSTISGGYLNLTALARGSMATASQAVTVNEPGVEHALRIVVERGPVTFRCGSTAGGDDYVAETTLRTGTHSLAFTPSAGSFYIKFQSDARPLRRVDSVTVEAAGIVVLPTPWPTADIHKIRVDQSADVVFAACDGYPQKRIERRSSRSWSVTSYQADDGPFTFGRTRGIKLKPSVTEGNGTLTASAAFFTPEHVGTLFKLRHEGQSQTVQLADDGTFTDPIRVTGIRYSTAWTYNDRDWDYAITGTWSGTITVQRSFDSRDAGFGDYDEAAYTVSTTSNVSETLDDNNDNAIIYYRVGFKEGDYTSGTATVSVQYDGGGGYGICRVVGYTSATVVDIEVLTPFTNSTFTDDWQEGDWSDARSYPSAVTFHDGRLWWAANDKVYGSVSDAYDVFDEETEGDSAPIIRSIATGGFERIFWLLSNQRLLAGTGAQEISIRASSFDEPLTTTQFTARAASDRGSADIQAIKADARGIFVQRSGKRVFEMLFDAASQDFGTRDLTRLCPEICGVGVREMAVQRDPDKRVWVVLNDGTCAVLTHEPADEVVAWTTFEMPGGTVKSVAVIPGESTDEVWFVVERTIDGASRHFIEVLASADECEGGQLNKTMDSHIVYSGAPTTSITGLSHLIGEEVVVWGDGEAVVQADAPLTVNGSGAITLPSAVSEAVIGLPYTGQFKSSKLAYAAQAGTALLQKKKVSRLGLLMRNVGWDGVRVGRDFTNMSGLPAVYKGKALASGEVVPEYDQSLTSFNGAWDTDSRICFEVSSPHPATFMGMVVALETNEAMSMKPGQGE
jgi:hypothetical protein